MGFKGKKRFVVLASILLGLVLSTYIAFADQGPAPVFTMVACDNNPDCSNCDWVQDMGIPCGGTGEHLTCALSENLYNYECDNIGACPCVAGEDDRPEMCFTDCNNCPAPPCIVPNTCSYTTNCCLDIASTYCADRDLGQCSPIGPGSPDTVIGEVVTDFIAVKCSDTAGIVAGTLNNPVRKQTQYHASAATCTPSSGFGIGEQGACDCMSSSQCPSCQVENNGPDFDFVYVNCGSTGGGSSCRTDADCGGTTCTGYIRGQHDCYQLYEEFPDELAASFLCTIPTVTMETMIQADSTCTLDSHCGTDTFVEPIMDTNCNPKYATTFECRQVGVETLGTCCASPYADNCATTSIDGQCTRTILPSGYTTGIEGSISRCIDQYDNDCDGTCNFAGGNCRDGAGNMVNMPPDNSCEPDNSQVLCNAAPSYPVHFPGVTQTLWLADAPAGHQCCGDDGGWADPDCDPDYSRGLCQNWTTMTGQPLKSNNSQPYTWSPAVWSAGGKACCGDDSWGLLPDFDYGLNYKMDLLDGSGAAGTDGYLESSVICEDVTPDGEYNTWRWLTGPGNPIDDCNVLLIQKYLPQLVAQYGNYPITLLPAQMCYGEILRIPGMPGEYLADYYEWLIANGGCLQTATPVKGHYYMDAGPSSQVTAAVDYNEVSSIPSVTAFAVAEFQVGGTCTCSNTVVGTNNCAANYRPEGCAASNPCICRQIPAPPVRPPNGTEPGNDTRPDIPVPFWAECAGDGWNNIEGPPNGPVEKTGGVNKKHPKGEDPAVGIVMCGDSGAYCAQANDGNGMGSGPFGWTYNFDNFSYAVACTDFGYAWTNNWCCSELDDTSPGNDTGESYNDWGSTIGACFNGMFFEEMSFVNFSVSTATGNTTFNNSVVVHNGSFKGCAIVPEGIGGADYGGLVTDNIMDGNDGIMSYTHYPDPGGGTFIDAGGDPTTPLITSYYYCTNLTWNPGYLYCAYTEEWVETDNPLLNSHFTRSNWTVIDYNTTPEQEVQAGCCAPGDCWNETFCQNDQTDYPASIPVYTNMTPGLNYEFKNYWCENGTWGTPHSRCTPDGMQCGWCAEPTSCLIHLGFQGCIGTGEWKGDFYCDAGNWTTRTRILAEKLLQIANGRDFKLQCDSSENTLPTPTDTVANKHCTLLVNGYAPVIGAAIGGAMTQNAIEMALPMLEAAYIKAYSSSRQGPDTWASTCTNSTLGWQQVCVDLSNLKAVYDAQTKIIIMSSNSQSLGFGAIKRMIDWFRDILGIGDPISLLRNFDFLYLEKSGNKVVTAVNEKLYNNVTLMLDNYIILEYSQVGVDVNEVAGMISAENVTTYSLPTNPPKEVIVFRNPTDAYGDGWSLVSASTRLS
ncbi:hypothetical protein ACFL1B_04970 [Nanoarchaeota archaeon]